MSAVEEFKCAVEGHIWVRWVSKKTNSRYVKVCERCMKEESMASEITVTERLSPQSPVFDICHSSTNKLSEKLKNAGYIWNEEDDDD